MREQEELDVTAGVRAVRPGKATKGVRTKKRTKKVGLDTLIQRFENGCDLWAGQQLQGQDAEDWLRLQYEMAEEAMQEDDAEEYFERNILPFEQPKSAIVPA